MELHKKYVEEFYLFMRILLQKKNSKNKIYSLHETHAYAVTRTTRAINPLENYH